MKLLRLLLLLVVLVLAAAAAGVAWLAAGPGPLAFAQGQAGGVYAGASPTGAPPELARADLVTRGRYLAQAADCESCHTAPGGQPFAGGRAIPTVFGTLYSSNITPDASTGIGRWSDADFLRAVHQGIGKDGQPLYPAFPYDAYSHMADADALAIKAYLFSLKPVRRTPPPNAVRFPFDQRWLLGVWARLFSREQGFRPVANRSPEWNRGAYLAEALAHCGSCHTPRHPLQGLDNRSKFAGGDAEGWRAYNITSDRLTGIGGWSDKELNDYLSKGHTEGLGTASGPMGEAVDLGLSHLTQGDVSALIVYLRSIPPHASKALPTTLAGPAPAAPRAFTPMADAASGKAIFEGACASCHGWEGRGNLTTYATLTGSRSVNDPSAVNVAQVVISGSRRTTPQGEAYMPAFGAAYSDAEIAAVANYVTGRFGSAPSHLRAQDVAALRRK
jgi:mono/diheme cytochrome c family protein